MTYEDKDEEKCPKCKGKDWLSYFEGGVIKEKFCLDCDFEEGV
jgi:uncharacterized metal-binding protein (TIGR02443 family)